MRTQFVLCTGLLALSGSGGVNAHHSGAMFDDKRAVVLSGVVQRYQFTNPHCWIQLLVTGADGPREWSIEMGSPSLLYRGGWRPTTLSAGDHILVTVRPMRDGSNGALYVSSTRENGESIGLHNEGADKATPPVQP